MRFVGEITVDHCSRTRLADGDGRGDPMFSSNNMNYRELIAWTLEDLLLADSPGSKFHILISAILCSAELSRKSLDSSTPIMSEDQFSHRPIRYLLASRMEFPVRAGYSHVPASLLCDDSNAPFANARVWASAIRNCHNHDNFVRTWRIVARNCHRSEMIKRPDIVLVG